MTPTSSLTILERLTRLEEVLLRIEGKLDGHIAADAAVEKRVGFIEKTFLWTGGFLAGMGVLYYDKIKAFLF